MRSPEEAKWTPLQVVINVIKPRPFYPRYIVSALRGGKETRAFCIQFVFLSSYLKKTQGGHISFKRFVDILECCLHVDFLKTVLWRLVKEFVSQKEGHSAGGHLAGLERNNQRHKARLTAERISELGFVFCVKVTIHKASVGVFWAFPFSSRRSYVMSI